MPNPANPQSFNRYSYCLNNPLKYIDPSGHQELGDIDAAANPSVYYFGGVEINNSSGGGRLGGGGGGGGGGGSRGDGELKGGGGDLVGSSSPSIYNFGGCSGGGNTAPSLPLDKGGTSIGGEPSPSLPDSFQGNVPESAKPDIAALAFETLDMFAPFAIAFLTCGEVAIIGAGLAGISIALSATGAGAAVGIVGGIVGVVVAAAGLTGMGLVGYSAYQVWNAQDFGGRWGQALGLGQ